MSGSINQSINKKPTWEWATKYLKTTRQTSSTVKSVASSTFACSSNSVDVPWSTLTTTRAGGADGCVHDFFPLTTRPGIAVAVPIFSFPVPANFIDFLPLEIFAGTEYAVLVAEPAGLCGWEVVGSPGRGFLTDGETEAKYKLWRCPWIVVSLGFGMEMKEGAAAMPIPELDARCRSAITTDPIFRADGAMKFTKKTFMSTS